MERFQNSAAIGSKDLVIQRAYGLYQLWRRKLAGRRGRRLRVCGLSVPSRPSSDFVLWPELQFFVERLALWRGIELQSWKLQLVEVFDCPLQQPCSQAAAAMVRVHQHHANPRESILEGNRRHRAAHLPVDFGNKASVRA